MGRSLLITGGAGFIGSNFCQYWCDRYPGDRVTVLDALTYAGNRQHLAHLESAAKLTFIHGDIADRALVSQILTGFAIDTIVNFAAESHVDRSISGPEAFIQTNIVGTFTLLECFRNYRQDCQPARTNQPTQTEEKPNLFLQISTDEVYGSLSAAAAAFTEPTAFAPNSPYAASKASGDHLVRAYYQTYGLPTIVTHCSNNYGPYQFPEKLIPLMCINILQGKPLPIYGSGGNIRDWIYVDDHCRALDAVIHFGRIGDTYNIGGNHEICNLNLVEQICGLMDQFAPDLPVRPSQQLIQFVTDRAGHDWRYAINNHKITTELGWQPQTSIDAGLTKTVQWYCQWYLSRHHGQQK
jgi:dTDP-glucose 4,6-dehydratase